MKIEVCIHNKSVIKEINGDGITRYALGHACSIAITNTRLLTLLKLSGSTGGYQASSIGGTSTYISIILQRLILFQEAEPFYIRVHPKMAELNEVSFPVLWKSDIELVISNQRNCMLLCWCLVSVYAP